MQRFLYNLGLSLIFLLFSLVLMAEPFSPQDIAGCPNLKSNHVLSNQASASELSVENMVWRVGQNRWTTELEEKFSKWVQENVDEKFTSKYNIKTDCADFAIVTRIVFARIHHLPVLFKAADRVFTQASTLYSKYPTVNWTESNWQSALLRDKRLRAFIDDVNQSIGTENLPNHLYPIDLKFMSIGTVLLDSDHTRIVIGINENDIIPIKQLSSPPNLKVNELERSGIDLDTPVKIGQGVTAWRWPIQCTTNQWKFIERTQQPFYAETNYNIVTSELNLDEIEKQIPILEPMVAKAKSLLNKDDISKSSYNDLLNFLIHSKYLEELKADKKIYKTFNNTKKYPSYSYYISNKVQKIDLSQFEKLVDKQINDLVDELNTRVKIVAETLSLIETKGPAFKRALLNIGSPEFEAYSTPSRDYQGLSRIADTIHVIDDYASETNFTIIDLFRKMSNTQIEIGRGKKINLLFYFLQSATAQASADPASTFETRWGITTTALNNLRNNIKNYAAGNSVSHIYLPLSWAAITRMFDRITSSRPELKQKLVEQLEQLITSLDELEKQ